MTARPGEERRPSAAASSFFRSRWVDPPGGVSELDPTALPRGYRAGAAAAGIKEGASYARSGGDAPLDVGILVSDPETTVSAARFCQNALLGAPVLVTAETNTSRLCAVLANSGNSNVATGETGVATARASQEAAGEALGIEPRRIGLASTGVIGRELPRARLVEGARAAAAALGDDSDAFSRAILTTDRGPKRACLEVALPSGESVRLAAQAKGAGMLSPKFATMFCFVETDAAVTPETLDLLTGVCVRRSFDRISVDGQLSTSDTVISLANGAAGVDIAAESPDELALGEALDALLRQLAIDMVADGEGASRVGRVVVQGAQELVEPVARAIADSPLVKTALLGADPNFGRILQAAGQALAGRAPFEVDLAIEGLAVASAGKVHDLPTETWQQLETAVSAPEVEFEVSVPGAGGETERFFSDLTADYVALNSEYST